MLFTWFRSIVCGSACLCAIVVRVQAASIALPNSSFESPATIFVDTRIDAWQKTAKPDWYDETGGFLWDQLSGVFANTVMSDPRHIDNMNGTQALYLFAVPQVGIFQDYDSTDWAHTTATHDFNARFEVGKSYQLIAGVIGGGGGMSNGATLLLALYYRLDPTNTVIVAATNIMHTSSNFPSTTHFLDCHADLPPVQPGDPWAGKNIGIQLYSTVNPLLSGGYWDVDNIRLISTRAPALSIARAGVSNVVLSLASEPGLSFDILATTNLTLPSSTWTAITTLTNTSGSVAFTNSIDSGPREFFRARQLP